MTVINENPRRSVVVIAGSAICPFNFPILSEQDIEVIQGDTTLLLNLQYTVDGVGNDGGGSVTLLTNPSNGTVITMIGKQPIKQDSTYQLEAFPPQRLQNDFNKHTIADQQLAEIIMRCLKLNRWSQMAEPLIPDPTAVDQFLRVASVAPLALGWGTLAVLAGAVGIPL